MWRIIIGILMDVFLKHLINKYNDMFNIYKNEQIIAKLSLVRFRH